jgi:hypothetical protein
MDDQEWNLKTGPAVLVACLVRTLQQTDPTFEERFLEILGSAYDHFKHDHEAFRSDGSRRDMIGVLESISWTREMLTGWSNITGQGEPFLK